MTKDMTSGNPMKIILLFSFPVLLGNLFQQFYNMVDTIIVGRYLGEEALAAVGSTGSLMFLVLGFANGIAQGFGVMVSHAFGAKDYKLLKHYVALTLMLTVVVSVILTVPTVALSKVFLTWMNTPDNIINLADAYIRVIYGGILLTMFYNVLSGLLRSIGDSRTPLYFLIFSSFLNIVLDLFLIIKMDMGTAGAAYATVIAQGISAALCFVYMFSHFDVLKTTKDDYYFDARSVYNMLAVGIPMALNYSITAIGTMVMQSAVNVFGSNVVASYTAASKVYNISVQSLPTLGTALATYCGQNLGAKRYDRIYDGMKQGFIICFVAAVCGAAICLGGGRFVVSWFVSNPSEEIFTYAMTYLKIASCFYLPLGMIFLYRNALQGLGEGFFPMISGVLEMLCRLAVIFFVPASAGFAGVCFADPAAWVGAGIPLLIVYLRWERRHQARYTSEKKI